MIGWLKRWLRGELTAREADRVHIEAMAAAVRAMGEGLRYPLDERAAIREFDGGAGSGDGGVEEEAGTGGVQPRMTRISRKGDDMNFRILTQSEVRAAVEMDWLPGPPVRDRLFEEIAAAIRRDGAKAVARLLLAQQRATTAAILEKLEIESSEAMIERLARETKATE